MTEGKATPSKDRIAWGRYLLLVVVAAWMFVLGVLVGRGTAPVRFDTQALQKEIAALRDSMLKKEREAVEKAIRGESGKEPLEFYEALKKDGPDAGVHLQNPPPSHPGADRAPGEEAPKPAHKSRAALMTKTGTARSEPAAASPPPQPPPADADGKLTIQVAALKDGAAAERIVANLKRKGYPAYLSRIVLPDTGLVYRVRVGSYGDSGQAAADMARLARDQKAPILIEKQENR